MNAFVPLAMLGIRAADLSDSAERSRIDAFVTAQPDAEPFHLTAWSRGVETGCGQRAHYLVAERGGEVRGLLPLSAIRSRLFGSALVSTGFGVGGGVLGEGADLLAAAAVDLARELGVTNLELRGGAIPTGWQVRDGSYAGFARDLPTSDDAILKAIPRKQRAEVRRAQTFGLETRIASDERALADHYRIYSESVRNLGTPVFPRALFRAMMDAFGEQADILTVTKDGAPVASVFTFYFNNTAYPYWGGGTAAARSLRANELMYFELMRHAAGRGYTRFDFGRSKTGTGAFAYKKNWGFEPRPLRYAVRSLDGAPLREINPLSPRYRFQVEAWRKLPLPLANLVGPWIARGLG